MACSSLGSQIGGGGGSGMKRCLDSNGLPLSVSWVLVLRNLIQASTVGTYGKYSSLLVVKNFKNSLRTLWVHIH